MNELVLYKGVVTGIEERYSNCEVTVDIKFWQHMEYPLNAQLVLYTEKNPPLKMRDKIEVILKVGDKDAGQKEAVPAKEG